jgi:hypothetical protein
MTTSMEHETERAGGPSQYGNRGRSAQDPKRTSLVHYPARRRSHLTATIGNSRVIVADLGTTLRDTPKANTAS